MREIKFRAWDRVLKRMLIPKFIGNGNNFCSDDLMAVTGVIDLMQFTGLKDKNGNPIYEGDLLIHDGDKEAMFEVFYNDHLASFSISRVHYKGSRCGGMIPPIGSPYLEIIGNLYESPELLKV